MNKSLLSKFYLKNKNLKISYKIMIDKNFKMRVKLFISNVKKQLIQRKYFFFLENTGSMALIFETIYICHRVPANSDT